MTDLYIHIGAPKTGTTAIQHYLLANREHLARNCGVLYPSGGLMGAGHHVIGAAVFPERSYRLKGVTRKDALQRSLDDVHKEMESFEPHTVILSTEYLWRELSAEDVRSLLQPFSRCRIRIVAYLRRQDLLAQSLYVQAVKGGLADPFPAWLERVAGSGRAGFDFHKVLSAWTTAGVPAEVIVRVYERSQLKSDICSDFLTTVCPQGVSLPVRKSQVVNPGPDRATVELLRLVSGKISDRSLATDVRKRILAHSGSRPLFAPLNYLSATQANDFMARFAELNTKVARDFLKRADGKLFAEARPAEDSAAQEAVQPQEVLGRLVDLLPVLLAGAAAGASTSKAGAGKREKRPSAAKSPRDEAGIGSL